MISKLLHITKWFQFILSFIRLLALFLTSLSLSLSIHLFICSFCFSFPLNTSHSIHLQRYLSLCIDSHRYNLSLAVNETAATSFNPLNLILSVSLTKVSISLLFSSVIFNLISFPPLWWAHSFSNTASLPPYYLSFTYLAPSAVRLGLKNISLLMLNLCVMTILYFSSQVFLQIICWVYFVILPLLLTDIVSFSLP